eukprot:SAG31_NODE_255_length_19039_cov_83.461774_15_plen_287_part_00
MIQAAGMEPRAAAGRGRARGRRARGGGRLVAPRGRVATYSTREPDVLSASVKFPPAQRTAHIARVMSTDMEPGLMYRCIKRSQVRKDSSKSSEKVAVLNIGDIIEVLAVHKLPNGVLRIQCVAGWISWVAANGDRTLEAVDTSHVMPAEYSENVTVPAAHALGKDFPHRQTAEEKKAAATTAHEAHLYHHRHPPHLVKQVLDVFHAGVAKYDKTPAEARGIQTVLSDDVIVQLKSIFEDMDIDHSGAIDVEDVIPILKQFSVTGMQRNDQQLLPRLFIVDVHYVSR